MNDGPAYVTASGETLTGPPSPYETGVCPSCQQTVEIDEIATGLNGQDVTVLGRWKCRTRGCPYGLPVH